MHALGMKDEQEDPSQNNLLYQTASLTPLPANCTKLSELHSMGMALVTFIWGHLNTAKEELMRETCVCYIHLGVSVR